MLDTLLLALGPVLSVGVILWMRRRTRRRMGRRQ